jgi:hypothetical protein
VAGFAVRQIDCGDPFVLIQKLCQITGNSGFIVRMGYNEQNIGLEPNIRLGGWG